MLRAIIIDDIDTIRTDNANLITKHCPSITIIAQANSVATGVKIIKEHQPDLVFLDVEMTDGTGFDLLKQLQPITFKVIFVSGYESFAVRAFKCAAIDYLLKPINTNELIDAVTKAQHSIERETMELKFSTLFNNLERPKNLQKLILKTFEKIYSVNVQDIIRCEGATNYTTFYLLDGSKIMVSKIIKEYNTLLTDMGFFRTHQSHLINMAYFDYYNKTDGGIIVLKDRTVIPLSTRNKTDFLLMLEKM